MAFHIPDEHITHRFETVSPQQARHMLTKTVYHKQRVRDETYVHEYQIIMARKEWRPATDIAFGRWNKQLFLLNGSHTLEAIARGKDAVLLSILTYECQEESELYELYLTYDRNRLRSLDQLYTAFGFGERHNLNKEQTRHLGATTLPLAMGFGALLVGRTPFRILLHSGPIRLAMMSTWVDEAHEFFETITGCPQYMGKPLRRSSVIALALVTFRFAPDQAALFWRNVAWDDRLASDDPQKTLNRFLREHPQADYPHHAYARYIAFAWNASWHKQARKTLSSDSDIPIMLEGTPHTRKATVGYLSGEGLPLHDPLPIAENVLSQVRA